MTPNQNQMCAVTALKRLLANEAVRSVISADDLSFAEQAVSRKAPGAPLTERERLLLRYVVQHQEHYGCCPNYEQIAEGIGLSKHSKSSVHRHILALEERGYLVRGKRSGSAGRNLIVLGGV